MKRPIATFEGQAWIDSPARGYRSYVVKNCTRCHRLWWTRKDGTSQFCSYRCASAHLIKLNSPCIKCQKPIPRGYSRMKTYQFIPRKFCSRSCALKYLVAERHSQWKGGFQISRSGYKLIRVGKDIYKPEHRLVMERYLGRRLRRKEVVHHINHNKLDNRIENLALMDNREHSMHHNALMKAGYPVRVHDQVSKLPKVAIAGKTVLLQNGYYYFGYRCSECSQVSWVMKSTVKNRKWCRVCSYRHRWDKRRK